jgi:hypothetical protein
MFIIGAARSGTTVLQNALNDAPDIFLLGEPDFLHDQDEPGFAARYNAMHRAWANQETKSTFCPAILPEDGTWREYVAALAVRHRYVGAKFVINPVREQGYLDRLCDFFCREFYQAKFLFAFRRPVPTILSTRGLQMLVRGESDPLETILSGYAETAALYIRMLRILPAVRAVFHEHVDRATFDGLEHWLGVPLAQSDRYYRQSEVRHYDATTAGLGHEDVLAALDRVYDGLERDAAMEFRALQAEQNDNHLSDTHFTAIGRLDRELRAIIARLSEAR